MITGGFGTTIDTRTGLSRRWYIKRDGIKRRSDNDQPVNNIGIKAQTMPSQSAPKTCTLPRGDHATD